MKRRILALLLAVLTLTALTAAAFATGTTTETLGAFNLKADPGYTLTVEGGGTGTGGFYANAKKFKLTCENLTGKYSLVLLLKEGADQSEATKGVPTESNLQYIDQQNIEPTTEFILFPKQMETGTYNVYVSTDSVNLTKVASLEYGTEPEYTLGDVDQNNKINIADVSTVLKYIASLTELSSAQFKAADVREDKGKVDIKDVAGILYYIAYGEFK